MNLRTNIKKPEEELNPYYKEDKNVDRVTFLILLIGIVLTILNIIYNYSNNLIGSFIFGVFIFITLSISMVIYFKLGKYTLGTYLSVIGTTLGVSLGFYMEGRVSFNFIYYFPILLSIPFLVKRNKTFLKNNYILFILVSIIAIISLSLAPVYPNYNFLSLEDIYSKMILNSVASLFAVVFFSVVIVYTTANFIKTLITDKKEAETEKDKRVTTLGSLGHELRTQINSINGITQLIAEQKRQTIPNKKLLKKYATILDKCNAQMLNLVNDLLDTHKIESGKFELIEQPENLNHLLNKVCDKYNRLASDKKLIFKKNISSKIINSNYVFDKIRLLQVLNNLLSNALKYTHKGTITFNVSLLEETDKDATILFEIKDTGIGISKKNHSKIFESFQQIKSENSDIYGGTGLGLSLTKTILDKMDSKIDVESKINEGSTFSFVISFEKTSQKSIIQDTDTLISDMNCLKDKIILIAEDNAVNLLYTDTLLKKYSAKTYLAKDGIEAIEIATTNPEVNTVLLDLEMPKLNGLQAISKIKNLNPNQKVIAFTANIPNEELLKKLYTHGFDDFITKPFKKEELLKTIYLNHKNTKLE